MSTPVLTLAANERAWLIFGEVDTPEWRAACQWLSEGGFAREGDAVIGVGEGILPSFVKEESVIVAGFDEWSGSYLMAEHAFDDSIIVALARFVKASDQRGTV